MSCWSSISRHVCLAILTITVAGASPSTFLLASDEVKEAFRDFYLPLVPGLEASYANVRFRVASAAPQAKVQPVFFASGRIGLAEVEFREYERQWLRNRNVSTDHIEAMFPADDEYWAIVVRLPEMDFKISDYMGNPEIIAYYDGYDYSSDSGQILLPTWCLKLRCTYASLLDRNDIEWIEFVDEPGDIKLLKFRPADYVESSVVEVRFDARTGACRSVQDFVGENDSVPRVLTVEYADDSNDSAFLPQPIMIRRLQDRGKSDGPFPPTLVLQYQRGQAFPPNSFYPSAFGYDDELLNKPRTVGEHVTTGATNTLMVILAVVLGLFMFAIAACICIAIAARWLNRT